MIIHLEYAAQPQPQGGILVKPFCYAFDDTADADGGAPVRDANYAQHLVHKFTERLPGEYSTEPPTDDWSPVFRIVLSVEDVRGGSALYCVRDYERLDCSAIYNEVCSGYMELYAKLKAVTRAARKRREAERKLKLASKLHAA